MSRARIIKPGFFDNEELCELPFQARILYIGLWCLADREGRLEDRPKRIKASIFPYDALSIDSLLAKLELGGFMVRYEVDGRPYIWLPSFKAHQHPHPKEAPSTLPACPKEQPSKAHASTMHDLSMNQAQPIYPPARSGNSGASRVKAEAEAEAEAEHTGAAGDDGRDIGFSERLGTLITRFGGNINPGLFREFELIAEDFTQEQIVAALDSLSRKQPSKRPYPGAIRAEIEPPKAKSLDDPFAAMVVKGYDQ